MPSPGSNPFPLPRPVSVDDAAFAARDRLLRSISEENDLPALGSSVARVVQLASSDGEAVRELAYFVLSDVALTQKILRLSNTVVYRTYSGAPITTVSKAIFMLGFEVVRTSALAMLLVDGMSGNRAACVRAELAQALSASVIGREMARRSHFKESEEAAIAALFKNMGRLLVAAHDHVLYNQIDALIAAGTHTPNQASTQVLGCGFDMLAESVLHEWNIPDAIIKALNPLPSGMLKPARSRPEWMQQVAAFSGTAATLIPHMHERGHEAACRTLLARYGVALSLEPETLTKLFEGVAQEIRILTDQANLTRRQSGLEDIAEPEEQDDEESAEENAEASVLDELMMTLDDDASESGARHPSGKPLNSRTQLMAGVQDVMEMMASGRCKVNDLIMLVLETIYRSMGFRFATICLKDAKTSQYRARISFGESNLTRQTGFVFPGSDVQRDIRRDIFQLAMERDADLMISDASVGKIRDLIPTWHRTLLPDARSFIILPLVVQKKPFGFFYADRAQPAPEGVPPDETSLIKTLKAQVLAALNAR